MVHCVKCTKEVKTDGNREATAIWWGWGGPSGSETARGLERTLIAGERQTVHSRGSLGIRDGAR